MNISTTDLINIIDILKDKIISEFGSEIVIDKEDFYWELLTDDIYDPYNEPSGELVLGQLSDDWEELLRLKNKKQCPLSYDLVRLSVILNIIRKRSIGKW